MDQRPYLNGDFYPIYVDGAGWSDEGTRDAGYCPVCNPKNYEVWEHKLRLEKERKELQKEVLQKSQEVQYKALEEDRIRAKEVSGIL
jgi:hypothetical protein